MKKSQKKNSAVGQSIIQGLSEAVKWANAEPVAVRRTTVRVPVVDVKRVRVRMGLSQSQFAHKYGFSPASVRNWEQGRRQPEGPARILLAVIDRNPEVVQTALAANA